MRERKRYVYVVVGMSDYSVNFDGCYLEINDEHGAHSTLEKAQEELKLILAELRKERQDMAYELTDTCLSVEYSDCVYIDYYIHKMLVN